MLDDGYTLDGAATALGWSRQLVSARAKILQLPQTAQQLLDTGALPVGTVDTLLAIAAVSAELCSAAIEAVAAGEVAGAQFASDPGWVLGQALSAGRCKAFAAYLTTVSGYHIGELRLGKKTDAAYREAEQLHKQLDRYAYGPPTIRFEETEVDQARAAGVLIEFDRGAPIITDRPLYRELVKQAIARTLEALRASRAEQAAEKAASRQGQREQTPRERLDAEHRAAVRELTARAHGVNLDLGAALLNTLSLVDPADMDVARFFAYGLLGPDTPSYLGSGDHTARVIAANGIRLVLDEHRTTTTPTLKSGQAGKTKVAYGDVDAATKWLWKFVDGAKTAGELYGRTLVVFAAQHYAEQLVLARSQRSSSALPRSRNDLARKAFQRIAKDALPATHTQLVRALEREERAYAKRQAQLDAADRHDNQAAANEPVVDRPDDQVKDLAVGD